MPTEEEELIRLLAGALAVSHPIDDLIARPGTLKFLVQESIARHERLLESYVRDHGGRPDRTDGSEWHLTKQFTANVWDQLNPDHRLQLHVILERDEIPKFVAELREWITFIEGIEHAD